MQFPVSLLAARRDGTSRLREKHSVFHDVLSYGLVHLARNYLSDDLASAQQERVEDAAWEYLEQYPGLQEHFNLDDHEHVAYLAAADRLGILLKNNHMPADVELFHNADRVTVGRKTTRFPMDFYWDFQSRNDDRGFRVLAAVYAQVGSSARVVYREDIIASAAGFSHARELNENRHELDSEPLTLPKLRYTLDRLERRSLFFRGTATVRQTVYGRNEKDVIQVAAYIQAKATEKMARRSPKRRRTDLRIKAAADQRAAALAEPRPALDDDVRELLSDWKENREQLGKWNWSQLEQETFEQNVRQDIEKHGKDAVLEAMDEAIRYGHITYDRHLENVLEWQRRPSGEPSRRRQW